LEEEGAYYKIQILLSTGQTTKTIMKWDEPIEEEPYVQVMEGYLKKEDVALLPYPLNPKTVYAVNYSEDMIGEETPLGTHKWFLFRLWV
jgi:hypothetical protein